MKLTELCRLGTLLINEENIVEIEKKSASYNNLFKVFSSKFLSNFPNKPMFLHDCSRSLLRTLWKKEKLFIVSNFSFSRRVFHFFRELSTIFIEFIIVSANLLSLEANKVCCLGKCNIMPCSLKHHKFLIISHDIFDTLPNKKI